MKSHRDKLYLLKIRVAEKLNNFIFNHKLKKLFCKNSLRINVIYIVNDFTDSDIASLNTFFETDFSNFDSHIFFYISEKIKNKFQTFIETKQSISKKDFFYYNDATPLFYNVLDTTLRYKSDFVTFVSTQLVFHPQWLQKSIEAGAEGYVNEKMIKIAGFSSFNPNDFKLLKTLSENASKSYCIKNGFSFHGIIFPHFILKEIVSKLNKPFTEVDFCKMFANRDMGFIFSTQSYAEVHSYDTYNIFDSFQEKPHNLSFATQRVSEGWNNELTTALPKFERLVLHVNYGGLGDNLFMSPLPRIAKETGAYKKVFISNHSIFRHPDYKRLFWDMNPYIDGYIDEMGYYIEFLKFGNEINILDKIMLLHGLDDGKRYHEPEIFFKPELKSELKDKLIYDPNYISNVAKVDKSRVDKYFQMNDIKLDFQMKIRDNSLPTSHFSDWLESKSLEDFCSIIISCKDIYCLTTGTATLAPALGKKAIVFYSEDYNETFLHSKLNQYIKLTS